MSKEYQHVQIKLYEPTAPQLDALKIITEDKPQVAIVAFGRQTGKTYMMWMHAFQEAMNNDKHKILWVSPILDQALKVMKEIDDYFEDYRDLFGLIVKKFDRKYNNIFFHNGSVIRFRSADSGDNLRGQTNHLILHDEAAYSKQDFIQEVLMPMLTRTQGRMVLASTFNGKNWYWDWFRKGQEQENWESIKSIKRTYRDLNDKQVSDTVERIRKTMAERQFAQEFLCEPVSYDTVFSGVEDCIVPEVLLNQRKRLFLGMDIGISQDFTVLTCIDEDYRVVDIDKFHYRNEGMTNKEFKDRVIGFVHKHKEWCVAGYFEINNNEIMYDELCEDAVFAEKMDAFLVTPTTKPKMISNLILLFDKKKIQIPNNKDLVFELYDFTAKKNATGSLSFGNNMGKHDDMVMSLAHAAYCCYDYVDGGVTQIN
jgi:hypothetical protein